MLVSMDFPLMHRRQARAAAEMGEDDAAVCRFRAIEASQLSHQKRVGQPMKPIPPHPFRFVAARDRQQARHARQVMMKGRVEARYLGHVGEIAGGMPQSAGSLRADGRDRMDPIRSMAPF
jgi:hypothetical protein